MPTSAAWAEKQCLRQLQLGVGRRRYISLFGRMRTESSAPDRQWPNLAGLAMGELAAGAICEHPPPGSTRGYASPVVTDLHYEVRFIFMEHAHHTRDQFSIWVTGDERAFGDMLRASFPSRCRYAPSEPSEYHLSVRAKYR
jgi:hypothetical protein